MIITELLKKQKIKSSFKNRIGIIIGETYLLTQNNYKNNYINGDTVVVISYTLDIHQNVESIKAKKSDGSII